MPGNKSSNYSITLSKNNFDRSNPDYIGKLRSNFVGTQFTLFDNGANPRRAKNGATIRKELCHIEYVG